MGKKEIMKLLMPGIVVGFILGMILCFLVGVNPTDAIPNFIGCAMACAVPTLLNCVIVLKMGSKQIKRSLSIWAILKQIFVYILLAFLFGLFISAVVITGILKINTCELSVLVSAIYQSILGVVVSTLCAYIALTSYVRKVKYTRRK